MTEQGHTPSTGKVRRDITGGKRGQGNNRRQAIRRPDPGRVRIGRPDPSVTAVSGLVAFGVYLRSIGVDRELRELFGDLKSRKAAVYQVESQLRLLIDLFVSGESRVFGLESRAADPLFAFISGGTLPSIDTVYRDLARFREPTIAQLDMYAAKHGLAPVREARLTSVHVDIDTTVEPLFGEHEGGLPGPNPRYPGRPSYHPILARVAETDTVVGAKLRPGDTSFGGAEVPFVESTIDRVREAVGRDCVMYTRIDGAADCTAIMQAIERRGSFYVTKAKMTGDITLAMATHTTWKTIDRDAMGRPIKQVAVIEFARKEWRDADLAVRVVAVRTRDRDSGKQVHLWSELDYTVQAFLTNDWLADPEDVACRYDKRAGIEPLIAELKSGWGIGDVPTRGFDANHAAFLLKILSHNLLRRFVAAKAPALRRWRAPWIRRALIVVPGRLIRSGRSRIIRMAPRPWLPMLN